MSSPPPQGEGELNIYDEDSIENQITFGFIGDRFICGCRLPIHIADLGLHSLSCLYLQPYVKILRITDPKIFEYSGLAVPRLLPRRACRSQHNILNRPSSLHYRKMSELLGYKEDEKSGENSDGKEDPHCSLTTPPPHILGIQIDETKPNIALTNENNKHDSDEDSQQNGLLSLQDENSKGGESVDESAKEDMATVLDVLFGGERPTVASLPSNSSTGEISPPHQPNPSSTPDAQTSDNTEKENEGEKDKEESGSELNSIIDELDDKEINKSTGSLNQGQNAKDSDASSTASSRTEVAPSPPTTAPTPPTISIRPMLDLMGSKVKEEKIEEPFAALNDLVKNIPSSHPSPMSMQPSMPPSMPPMQHNMPPMQHNMPPHQRGPDNYHMMSSVPPPTMLGQQNLGQQVSIQKRPAPQSFPPGITMTKQPRRDSESSNSSREGASPRLPEGITLVKGSSSINQKPADPVANMLATRGVSVMPSSGPKIESNQAISITKAPPKPQILSGSNSALTITATPPKRNKPSSAPVSIDLTDDSAPPVRRAPVAPPQMLNQLMRPRIPMPMASRGRPPAATCDVCDKVFANAEALRIHMQTHTGRRGITNGNAMLNRPPMNRPPGPGYPGGPPNKSGSFECTVCTARYQTQQQLIQHTQRFHPDRFGGAVGNQFVLPVCDLNDSKTSANFASMGIKYCIPLCDLQSSTGAQGLYALPVIAMDGANNPAVCNLEQMNCSNLLPLGPLKSIRRQ